jgi:hypothetical protein
MGVPSFPNWFEIDILVYELKEGDAAQSIAQGQRTIYLFILLYFDRVKAKDFWRLQEKGHLLFEAWFSLLGMELAARRWACVEACEYEMGSTTASGQGMITKSRKEVAQ